MSSKRLASHHLERTLHPVHIQAQPSPQGRGGAHDALPRRLVIGHCRRYLLIDPRDIRFIESDGNYVRLHTRAGARRVRATMATAEARLDACRFLRIRRTTIVNVELIRELRKTADGAWDVELDGGEVFRTGRSYRRAIDGLIEDTLEGEVS